jgi:hypothetical protein
VPGEIEDAIGGWNMLAEDIRYLTNLFKKIWAPVSIALMVAAGGMFIFWMMRSTEFYEHSVDIAVHDRAVIQALGEPVRPGWWVMGSISSGGMSEEGDLRIPLKGSTGKGTLFAAGRVDAGRWTYFNLVVYVSETGETIDLRR